MIYCRILQLVGGQLRGFVHKLTLPRLGFASAQPIPEPGWPPAILFHNEIADQASFKVTEEEYRRTQGLNDNSPKEDLTVKVCACFIR